jgi:methyl-accepting chemotaxis protein
MGSTDAATAAWADCMADATRTWASHVDSVQQQLQQAIERVLSAFAQILEQLDQLVGDERAAGATDERVEMLARCESRLRELLANFDGFVRNRDEMLVTVKQLSEASGDLAEMADDVLRLARQTNLLSINAAIEAARAGPSGRGFAVVAGEVRRLSTESGDTGRRIGGHVARFSEAMQQAVGRSQQSASADTQAIRASEAAVGEVVAEVDAAVSALQRRAAEQREQGLVVKAQLEQVIESLQFQDRVHQILDQLRRSMPAAAEALGEALARGRAPERDAWQALLSAGYTTHEQRAVSGQAAATSTATVFF